MGDIIEFTTWQKHKNLFYKITSNSGINFDVKSSGSAAVGLTNDLGDTHSLSIIMGVGDGETVTQTYDNEFKSTIVVPNILNREEYKRFWISWAGNGVAMGKSGKKEALFQYKTKLPDLKYVTFSVVDNGPPVHWKFELPPILKEPSLMPISNGKLKWVQSDTQLPDDAVIGGFNHETIYIIRAKHRGSLTPGGFVPSEGCGYIPWGGQSHEKTTFEVLCGIDFTWVPTKKDKIPIGAMEAGYSEVHHEPLYIGRAFYNGSVIPGKVQPSHNVCYIYHGSEEKAVENYQILIVPDKNNIQSVEKVPHVNVDAVYINPIQYSPVLDDESDNNSLDDYYQDDYDEDEFNI